MLRSPVQGFLLLTLLTLGTATVPAAAHAVEADQGSPTTSGVSVYFGLEGGFGLAYGTSGSTSYEAEAQAQGTPGAISLLLGAVLSRSLLIGAEVGFTTTQFPVLMFDGLALTRVDAVATWFPAGNHLFLRGKAGVAHLAMAKTVNFFEKASSNQFGLDLGAGVGLAQRVGTSFTVTGALDLAGQWYGGAQDAPTASHALTLMFGLGWY